MTNETDLLQTRFQDAELLKNDKHSDQPVKVSTSEMMPGLTSTVVTLYAVEYIAHETAAEEILKIEA